MFFWHEIDDKNERPARNLSRPRDQLVLRSYNERERVLRKTAPVWRWCCGREDKRDVIPPRHSVGTYYTKKLKKKKLVFIFLVVR